MDEWKTRTWWTILRGIAVFNVLTWFALTTVVALEAPYATAQLVLCAVFTLVCAYRSFWPRIDLERLCMVDSYVSSVVAGRSAATVAEVSFAGQVGLMLHQLGGAFPELIGLQRLAVVVVMLLTIAQGFCWYGLLTRNHLGHAIEESLWALTFTLVGGALALSSASAKGSFALVTHLGALFCAGYVVFMVTVDVPMYVRRWRSGAYDDERLTIAQGWTDALHRRVVTKDWAVWKPEVAWLTGYFSGAVWVSLAMAALAGQVF